MKKFADFLIESKGTYFALYSDAVAHALELVKKGGYTYDDDVYFNTVAGVKKPSPGKTVSWLLPLMKNGKEVKRGLKVSVYNRDDSRRTVRDPFELTAYIS